MPEPHALFAATATNNATVENHQWLLNMFGLLLVPARWASKSVHDEAPNVKEIERKGGEIADTQLAAPQAVRPR